LFALLGSAGHHFLWPGISLIFVAVMEVVIIFLLYALAEISKSEDWREAYTDSRILAEALRMMKQLGPLGVHTPLPKLPGYLEGENKQSRKTRWSVWYFRALVRQAPLRLQHPNAHDVEKLRETLLHNWIGPAPKAAKDQTQYAHHLRNAGAQGNLENRIEYYCGISFRIVLTVAFFHLALVLFHELFHEFCEDHHFILKIVSVALFSVCVGGPALLSAFHGLLSQIEAKRLHERSSSMVSLLQQHHRAIGKLDLTSDPNSAEAVWGLTTEALATASLMMDEVADWSLIYDKDIPLH
jgi:uncharacterized membrane protein YhaH (DUF805 family)